MKNRRVLFISLVVVLGLAAFVAMQAQTKPKAPAPRVFVGTVDKVTPADPIKGTKPEIAVIDKTQKSMTFIITDTCTIYDAKGTAITLEKIVKGSEVSVKYKATPQGVHEAISIKLLK